MPHVVKQPFECAIFYVTLLHQNGYVLIAILDVMNDLSHCILPRTRFAIVGGGVET